MRLLFILAVAASAGQATLAQQPPPAFRSATRVVEIAITATFAPNKWALRDLLTPPVNDLHATDLRLFDNGIEQTIASFEKTGQGGAHISANPEPPPISIIALDSRHTGWVDQIYGRKGAIEMLNKLPPGDTVAVYSVTDQLVLLHDFSTDYGALRAAIDKFDKEFVPAPLAAGPHTLDSQVLGTLLAMTRIAEVTKGYPGKKILLWVSNPIPLFVSIRKDVVLAMRDLAAANVTLYTIDPAGLTMKPNPSGNTTELTELTGGLAFGANNDIGALIRRALDDGRGGAASGSYLLTFVPKDYKEDGTYHEVHLTTSRKRVDLRYRQGYQADHR